MDFSRLVYLSYYLRPTKSRLKGLGFMVNPKLQCGGGGMSNVKKVNNNNKIIIIIKKLLDYYSMMTTLGHWISFLLKKNDCISLLWGNPTRVRLMN